MTKELLTPDYIFESSWEVCNKVGGIYTVLSTRANTLQAKFHDRLFFIGPDFWQGKENPLFVESENLCAAWRKHATEQDNLMHAVNPPDSGSTFLYRYHSSVRKTVGNQPI